MNRNRAVAACLSIVLSGWAADAAAGESVVKKVAEPFDEVHWEPGQWSTAAGSTSVSAEGHDQGRSMQMEVGFSGKGFQFFNANPSSPLVIPGHPRTVTFRYKVSDKRYPLSMTFTDGWGRGKADGQDLKWEFTAPEAGVWQTATFTVPADWVRPVSITGLATHNWSAQNEKKSVRFLVDDLEVETDTAAVDAGTGKLKGWTPEPNPKDPAKALKECPRAPLLSVEFSTGQVSNVFSREEPSVAVTVRSWKPGTLAGDLSCEVLDDSGAVVYAGEKARFAVDSTIALRLRLPVVRFGRYTLVADLSLSDDTKKKARLVFARVPPYRELTEEQKLASPYGLNIHGGGGKPVIQFRKAGVVWIRDYAWQYDWMLRAKGDDKRYTGWPWYPQILARYREAGLEVVPCLQKSVKAPEAKDGKVVGRIGPDRAWKREIAEIVGAFPDVTHWELDNEYDLHKENVDVEKLIEWRNYRAYHKAFAEVLDFFGDGELVAVENGRAGMWPDRLKQCIDGGEFDSVQVVNSHHYCGPDAPEENFDNHNMNQPPELFFDRLRAVKRVALSDGRKRQSWLTEFGWDTLAGPIVSPLQQAVYLQRSWMMAMAAGTEKCFWFYDYDVKDPKQFFDGCGLLAADGSPKLSLSALAGMTSILYAPEYVGDINAGAGTQGYVFRNDGVLVAALWSVDEERRRTVRFRSGKLYDYLGNQIRGKTVTLSSAPVYAAGIDEASRSYLQTSYSLDTPHLMAAAAGDTAKPVLRVNNNREGRIRADVEMQLPPGWRAEKLRFSVDVAAGEEQNVEMPFTVGPEETLGMKDVQLVVTEGRRLKDIPLRVVVRRPIFMQVGPIEGRPGETEVTVTVGNRSGGPLDGTLRLSLPASWKAITPAVEVRGLEPHEEREIKFRLVWSTEWEGGESARAEFDAGDGRIVSRPVIPNTLRLHRAEGLKVDGRLDDWPARTQLPTWTVGSSFGEVGARFFLAWSSKGIHGAIEVADAGSKQTDPRSFWAGDCIELFIDTADDKGHRFFEPGDHQFWLVPLLDEKRTYVGRWKRKDEIHATVYDMQGVETVALRKGDGYVMEFLLPAASIDRYDPKVGSRIGFDVNLTARGKRLDRQVYWPRAKDWSVTNLPKTWGTLELVE
jgi:hypothetical protein